MISKKNKRIETPQQSGRLEVILSFILTEYTASTSSWSR